MKNFEKHEMEVINFSKDDIFAVITTSPTEIPELDKNNNSGESSDM